MINLVMFRFLLPALLPVLPLASLDCRPILMEQSPLLTSLQLLLPVPTIWPPSLEHMELDMDMELDMAMELDMDMLPPL